MAIHEASCDTSKSRAPVLAAALRFLCRRGSGAVAPLLPASHSAVAGTSVWFLGTTGSGAHYVGAIAGDRYRCQAGEGGEPELLVVAPADPGGIEILRRDYPGADIVVWDRREPAPPVDVAKAIYAGADVYVAGASPKLLVAYLDAFLRRERPALAPLMGIEAASAEYGASASCVR